LFAQKAGIVDVHAPEKTIRENGFAPTARARKMMTHAKQIANDVAKITLFAFVSPG